jgi:pimeloyl-ACP methyl ester carboxylesterase
VATRALATTSHAAIAETGVTQLPPYGNGTLPEGIRTRIVSGVNGLTVHMLEAGTPGRPAVLLLHGFPELAYSWRKVMLPLANAGYYVIAPDLRGFGRTTGWGDAYDGDLEEYSYLNKIKDTAGLVWALGYNTVEAVVGHDLGSPIAGWSALVRPDVFRSVVMMSAPFPPTPPHPFDTANGAAFPPVPISNAELAPQLAALPRPRKYYMEYNRTREANANYMGAPQGLHDFFRAYYHYKSADWKGNQPFPLKGRTAEEMAKMPTYYVMDLNKGMAETVAEVMPSPAEIAVCTWLTDADVDVYAGEYKRTGFQGGLNAAYRVAGEPKLIAELFTFSGRTIDVPSCFVAGKSDWGIYQFPGAVEAMRTTACPNMIGFHILDGAGHWVQQERHETVTQILLQFLKDQRTKRGRKA